MQNATYLTEKFPRKEHEIWTPCILAFFEKYKPELPISVPTSQQGKDGIFYKSRQGAPLLKIDVSILSDRGNKIFLSKIKETFNIDLENDPGKYMDGCDISGVNPDFMLIVPDKGVFLIENKPYDSISWTPGQRHDGDYINFVKWLNSKGIHSEYIVIHSIGVYKNEAEIMKIKNILGDLYGSILLEDIFAKMSDEKFVFPGITDDWKEYTEKSHYLK